MMTMKSITDTENQAIEKRELLDYEQRELRGTGYAMMTHRDKGYGKMGTVDGKEIALEWNIEGGSRKRQDYEAYSSIPNDTFKLTVGNETVLIDKNTFHKIYRWC